MVGFILRRRYKELALDLVFAFWALHLLVTGRVVPQQIQELIHPRPPVAVVSEPVHAPAEHDDRVPAERPETQGATVPVLPA